MKKFQLVDVVTENLNGDKAVLFLYNGVKKVGNVLPCGKLFTYDGYTFNMDMLK